MAENSQRKEDNLQKLQGFFESLEGMIYPIDEETSEIYGKLCTDISNFYAPKEKSKRRKFDLERSLSIVLSGGLPQSKPAIS